MIILLNSKDCEYLRKYLKPVLIKGLVDSNNKNIYIIRVTSAILWIFIKVFITFYRELLYFDYTCNFFGIRITRKI